LFSTARITIKGVNQTGTNLKSNTKKIDVPKNHSNALNKKRLSLLMKVSEFLCAGVVLFFDVIFVAISSKSEFFIKVKKIASVLYN
jgi:hypothetical protein